MTFETLTKAEQTFIKRMAFHFANGKSVEESAQAVIADDQRLFEAFCKRSHSHYVPTADERGASFQTSGQVGDAISAHITKSVYEELRQ